MTGQIAAVNVATIVLLAVIAWRIGRAVFPKSSKLDHPAIFFLLVCFSLLVMRLPQIRWPHEYNMDESQMIAQAMRFLVHPIPWRDVDGNTSGPLNSLVLSAPIYFGAPANWETSRTILWASQCLTLLFLYLTLRTLGSRSEAELALAPTILFYAFSMDVDFTHYSSEAIPVLLITAVLYLLALEWKSASVSNIRLFVLGCASGMILMAKLQAAPLAMFLAAVACALAILKHRRNGALKQNWWKTFAAIAIGTVLVPGVILGLVVSKGAFDDFWTSYILAAAGYTQWESAAKKFANLWFLLYSSKEFSRYLASAVFAFILLLIACRGKIARLGARLAWPLVMTILLILLTLFCLYVAGKDFLHYDLLLVPSLTMLLGLAFIGSGKILAQNDTNPNAGPRKELAFVAVCLIAFQLPNVRPFLNGDANYARMRDAYPMSAVVKSALAAAQPGEAMAIWGWMPRYYIETGLYPGTRDASAAYSITSWPYQHYFRSRFLRDLKENRPVLFMDAVAQGMYTWQWSMNDRHENFPELTKFIDENYSLCTSISFTNAESGVGLPVRLYVLKERMAERHLSPTSLMLPER
jgi:hypothetical protein